jgi:hypothetical protein
LIMAISMEEAAESEAGGGGAEEGEAGSSFSVIKAAAGA